jgi:hypothetical protein
MGWVNLNRSNEVDDWTSIAEQIIGLPILILIPTFNNRKLTGDPPCTPLFIQEDPYFALAREMDAA